ncbi:hypothetical protein [Synoicihabitans lomoniglobus]|uniref:Glycine zipper 2TM domain-containing protein n=1 Tax=Synoicihabitans lomoniglobus TaxID=2909285 RepID=A0AAF0CRM6_9BACT|nr:hypothetical protein [Opitutaceae bacterium LMO-M01]WED66772.1 hypothetical protein PXH66_07905 [Opitutaceae bacterium LMO-M01]
MNLPPVRVMLASMICGTFAGCTMPSSTPLVPQAHVGVAAELTTGRVISSEPVTIEGDNSGIGTYGGAGLGGAGGVAAAGGGGIESIVASAAGAVAGSVIGKAVEERVTREEGQRVTIELSNGKVIEVVQSAKDGYFHEGDRVNVAMGDGVTRVSMAGGIDSYEDRPPAWYEVDDR